MQNYRVVCVLRVHPRAHVTRPFAHLTPCCMQCLVGSQGVGKSCMLYKFMNDEFLTGLCIRLRVCGSVSDTRAIVRRVANYVRACFVGACMRVCVVVRAHML